MLLAFTFIVLMASCVLAARLEARGRKSKQFVWLLIAFAFMGASGFGFTAVLAHVWLWGFGLDVEMGTAPAWADYLCPVAGVVGTLCGIAGAFYLAERTDAQRVHERREVEADYDEPQPPGPPDGPAPPP